MTGKLDIFYVSWSAQRTDLRARVGYDPDPEADGTPQVTIDVPVPYNPQMSIADLEADVLTRARAALQQALES